MSDVCYLYDGSVDGLLNCVFAAFAAKEHPDILREGAVQLALDQRLRAIPADPAIARRVEQGILRRIGPETLGRVQVAALSAHPQAARIALDYLRLGFQVGPRIDQRLAEEPVHRMNKLLRDVQWEAQRFIQFLRFSALEGGVYFAEMQPQHDVLMLVMPHFAERFNVQPFIIHDAGRRLAGVWDRRDWLVISSEGMRLPAQAQGDAAYQAAWKMFYRTIAIEQRINPKLRRAFMPKKYWQHMLEMQPEYRSLGDAEQRLLAQGEEAR